MPDSSPYFEYRGHPMFASIGPTFESLDEEYFKELVDFGRNHPELFMDKLFNSTLDPREHLRQFAAVALNPSSNIHLFLVGGFRVSGLPATVVPKEKWEQAILILADRLSQESSTQVASKIIDTLGSIKLTYEAAVIDAAIPRLISLVEHGDAAFQEIAVRGLRAYGPEINARAVHSLIAALPRARPSVHREICEALRRLGQRAEPAIEALIESLAIHQDDDSREDIALALISINQGPRLVSSLSDPGSREAFLETLRWIGPDTRALRDSIRDFWGSEPTRGHSGQTDKKTDKREKNWTRIPRDEDALRLARLIRNEENNGRPQSDVAIEFTEGDEKKARDFLKTGVYRA